MMNDVNTPKLVELPERISTLESARGLLQRADDSKVIHMSSRQAQALNQHIEWLETQLKNRDVTINNMAEQMAELGPANPYEEMES